MSYPEQLLPFPHYKLINFTRTSSRSYYLIRHTDGTALTDTDGRLKADHVAFNRDHLRDYSTNLLGEFQPQDISWQFEKGSSYLNAWQPGDGDVPVPQIGIDVNWITGRGGFFLLIADFHQASFPLEVEGQGTLNITCRVLHTPTRGNFWHCSLRWFVDDEDIALWKEKPRKRVLKAARNFIIDKAILEEPAYQAPPPDAYEMLSE